MLCYVILWSLDISLEIVDLGTIVSNILSYLNMHATEAIVYVCLGLITNCKG